MKLGSGKSLDNHQGATTFGTDPKWVLFLDGGCFWFGARWRYWVESLKAKQESGASPIGEEAKVANADEALGKQVQQEAAEELLKR